MIRVSLALTVLMALGAPATAQNRSGLEVDHIFIAVESGAESAIAVFRDAGFTVGDFVSPHEGRGTASRGVFFDNAYIELIYVDATVRLDSTSASLLERMRLATDWRRTGMSPFGAGLRRTGGPVDYGMPAESYTAAWLQPGTSIDLLVQPDEPNAAEVFVIPEYIAVPTWVSSMRRQVPAYFEHKNGATSLTSVQIQGPPDQLPRALRALGVPAVTLVESDAPLLELRVEGVTREIDLRPALPLVIRP